VSQGDGASCPVLIVEDDDDLRGLLRETIEATGHGVITAADGREALDVLSEGARPCLVLLDLMMPVMSGWEVLDALRRSGALDALPVVVVSAAARLGDALVGARGLLRKPVEVERLLATVEMHCPHAA